MKNDESILCQNWVIAAVILVIIFLFFGFVYGIIGIRLIIGIFVLYFTPFYFILRNFDLGIEEKILFSLFIGIGVVPIMIYYVSRIVGSLRSSIITSFVLIILIAIGINIYTKKYKNKKETKDVAK